ncbi:hypothetical protein M9Y82_16280 [Leptospira weilii]|uniref:hypothetical protein n=1 Tax=Leptospira TaxID=171 RepID=UPI00077455D5|nr:MULTISPECIES: hypothetical protein [Leptospira]MCL8268154.1 hypothetical protein [Leptospira weilii]
MIITNGDECKDFICITLKMKTLAKFARETGVNYDYLSKSLNGQHSYTEIREAFKKWNVPFRIGKPSRSGSKKKRRSAA